MIAINVADVVELFRRKARWKAVGLTSWPYALICTIVESINQAHAREDMGRVYRALPGTMGAQKYVRPDPCTTNRIDELIAQVNGQHANLTKYEEQIANHEASHKSTLTYYTGLLADAKEQIAQLTRGHETDMRILADERQSSGRYAKIADKRTEELAKERADHNMTATQLAHAELRIKELTTADAESTRGCVAMMRNERDAARAQAMDARKIIDEEMQRVAKMQESMRDLHDTVVRQAEALDNLPRIEQANRDLRAEAEKRIDQVCEQAATISRLEAQVKRLEGNMVVQEWEKMHTEICKALGVKHAQLGTHALCLNAIATLNRKAHHLGLYIAAVNGTELPKEPA